MKNTVIDIAISIDGFNHIEELILLINRNTPYFDSMTEMKRVFNGFELVLCELKNDIGLQRDTFYQTMLNVRNQFAVRNRHRHTAKQMNAITLAIAHVKYCLKMKQFKEQMKSVS
ncbi:hypothetical protein P5663_19260 [Priestia flexa]|uniref:hypothetical protein n=1 Tax=Priestia flexa TaxID=86664 RepID=UPI00240DB21C|nr:hypothetical protein [Priestia flexa]WEZ08135.1 hypothetical protein P5663_19260 [Priestia flexa]